MNGMMIASIILMLIGGGCALAHILLRRSRAYLLYIGFMFIAMGISIILPAGFRGIALAGTGVMAFLAMFEGIKESKDRVRRFREEQHDREAAFGEFMEAVARQEAGRETPKDAAQ